MGLINKSNIIAYWNTKDWSQSTSAFGVLFTRDRFLMLHLRHWKFEKDAEFNISVNSLEIIICPKKGVSIDESLIGYEGRGQIQYMPNKHHHHFRFKLFCLCENESGYT